MIDHNVSLKAFNSFGLDVSAKSFAGFRSLESLQELLEQTAAIPEAPLILGGGSNILFTKNYDGFVLKNEIAGIEKVGEDDEHVWIKAGAGENWHQFVLYCIRHNYAGVENLSLIPGCTGASPMQNIGAYGVEIKDVFDSLEAFHIKDKTIVNFSNQECQFGYRESVFKRKYKNQFVITQVSFRLKKTAVFHTSYGAIQQELENMGVQELSIKAISDAVIHIRQSKLPDPAVVGNAGSFFKNPTISAAEYLSLKEKFPAIPGYEQNHAGVTTYKVPAGWLIEQSGPRDAVSWKGFRQGDAGVHPRQALVLVNYAHATGKEIFDLSTQIKDSVFKKYGIVLEREVNII